MTFLPSSSAARQRLIRFLPALAVAIGGALSLGEWRLVRREARASGQARIERAADAVVVAIRERFANAEHVLRGASALVQIVPNPTRPAWLTYVNGAGPIVRKGLVGLGYVMRINRSQVPEIEAWQRSNGRPDFTVRSESSHDVLYIVTQIEPDDLNFLALGADIGAGTGRRRAAAETAMDTGEIVLTMRLPVFRGRDTVPGFLMFLPVYGPAAAPNSVAERRRALLGWVYAALETSLFMQGVLDECPSSLDCQLYEGESASPEKLIFGSGGPPGRTRGGGCRAARRWRSTASAGPWS